MRLVAGVLEPAQTPATCTATGTLRAAAAALRSYTLRGPGRAAQERRRTCSAECKLCSGDPVI
jgi:hypothetical protein